MTTKSTLTPEKAFKLLIETLDKDLAENLVLSAISMSHDKLSKIAETVVMVKAIRDLETFGTKEQVQAAAERIISAAMENFSHDEQEEYLDEEEEDALFPPPPESEDDGENGD